MPFLYERQVIPIIKITSYQLLPPFDNSRKAEVNGKWGAGYFSNNHLCITRGRDTECKETKKAPSACLFCPDALSHLGSPYRNEGPFLQMVPLLGRSLGPPGWGCQFRAAEASVVGKWSGTVQKGPAEVEAKRTASSICCILSADKTAIRT